MSAQTSIQWTDTTWNPTRGCSRVSAGCDSCYAMRQAHRFSGKGQPYEGLTTIRRGNVDWTGVARLIPEQLGAPLKWRKPQRIFVNSMSDLFHPSLSNEEIAAVFGVMAARPQHIFQVLTKQPKRAAQWFKWVGDAGWAERRCHSEAAKVTGRAIPHPPDCTWPLPNVHLGVSVENQKTANERIPILRSIRALVGYRAMTLFASCEPLLDCTDLGAHLAPTLVTTGGERLQRPRDSVVIPHRGGTWEWGLDWVIVGGESGAGARPCNLAWIESIVEQCRDAGVPCFVKQLGAKPYAKCPDCTCVPSTCVPSEVRYQRHHLTGNCGSALELIDRAGGDMDEWPESLRIRQFPEERG